MAFTPLGAALRSKLIADIPVLANRIFPQKLPQNTEVTQSAPAVTYKKLSDNPIDDVSGRATLYKAVIQYQTWAVTTQVALELADLIRKSLVDPVNGGFKGVLLGVTIQGIYHYTDMDDFEDEVLEYTDYARFSVWYRK